MKKIFILLILVIGLISLTGCNKDLIDTVFTFDSAIIEMPDNTAIKVKVKKWNDYENSDQIQITDTNGTIYLVHSSKVVLIND